MQEGKRGEYKGDEKVACRKKDGIRLERYVNQNPVLMNLMKVRWNEVSLLLYTIEQPAEIRKVVT
jgi:hypothetical protein